MLKDLGAHHVRSATVAIDAVVVEASALGGQAGISDRIDNYPGFPDGISGAELAERFVAQARRYGVELLPAVAVTAVQRDHDDLVVGQDPLGFVPTQGLQQGPPWSWECSLYRGLPDA